MTQNRRLSYVVLCACVLAMLGGCAPGETEVLESPIVGGTLGGDPAVVWIYNSAERGLCSGTLIDPRVILTAKHCVQPSGASGPSSPSAFVVGFGNEAGRGRILRVQSVHTTDGVWTEGGPMGLSGALVGRDVAVLVLSVGVSDVTPIPITRDSPRALIGQSFTATGFGQIPSGPSGTKYTTMGRVQSVSGSLIYVGAVTCQGDSGGPLITADHHVGGVVSFGSGGCGAGYGAYQAFDTYLDLIDLAIMEGGGCVNDGGEVCDGLDNDCNGLVDETCTPLGGTCLFDSDCVGAMCREAGGGMICTLPCDARRPTLGCEEGLFCEATRTASSGSCDGFCVPVTGAHDRPVDADCAQNSDCASYLCVDPGDGLRRCLSPCRGDAGECLATEACVATAGECGGCVPAAIFTGQSRGFGEPCGSNADCASSQCLTDGARSYCTRVCDGSDSVCGEGFHCSNQQCFAGPRGSVGDNCRPSADDCSRDALCVSLGARSWCTQFCGSSAGGAMCPDRFDCVPAGGQFVCAPVDGLVGAACTMDSDCVSRLCLAGTDGRQVCSRTCDVDTPCATGLECRRTADGASAFCLAPTARPAGGCSVSVGARPPGVGAFTALALAAAALLARRGAR